MNGRESVNQLLSVVAMMEANEAEPRDDDALAPKSSMPPHSHRFSEALYLIAGPFFFSSSRMSRY
jgi:hypothetical protein